MVPIAPTDGCVSILLLLCRLHCLHRLHGCCDTLHRHASLHRLHRLHRLHGCATLRPTLCFHGLRGCDAVPHRHACLHGFHGCAALRPLFHLHRLHGSTGCAVLHRLVCLCPVASWSFSMAGKQCVLGLWPNKLQIQYNVNINIQTTCCFVRLRGIVDHMLMCVQIHTYTLNNTHIHKYTSRVGWASPSP